MKIGYLFPAAVGIAGAALLIWFIASGAWMPGAEAQAVKETRRKAGYLRSDQLGNKQNRTTLLLA